MYPSVYIASWYIPPKCILVFQYQLTCYSKMYPSVSIASWCFTPDVFQLGGISPLQCALVFLQLAALASKNVSQHFYSELVYHAKNTDFSNLSILCTLKLWLRHFICTFDFIWFALCQILTFHLLVLFLNQSERLF